MDTIFALASAQGKAGVAVVRVSGPDSLAALQMLTGLDHFPDKPCLRAVVDKAGDLIDRALILAFPQGKSFTGEATVEFQLHGSPAIVKKVLAELNTIDNCRMADPGEFTRRAMANGQLDLAQVEGLADLLEAETESQRRQAISVFEGHLGWLATKWRTKLVRAGALLQAIIDFADEEVPEDVGPEVLDLVSSVQEELEKELLGYHAAERVRDGFKVAIVGKPNVGKSSLLNILAGRDVAITSDIAGTTRDLVEIHIDINGLAVSIVDTAGLRVTDDPLENLGIERAKTAAENADLRIFLGDDSGFETSIDTQSGDLHVYGKGDVQNAPAGSMGISSVSGDGIDNLRTALSDVLTSRAQRAGSLTRERHLFAVTDAKLTLAQVILTLKSGSYEPDLLAEDVRTATNHLGAIIGAVDVEDVLDVVFSSFCLGK